MKRRGSVMVTTAQLEQLKKSNAWSESDNLAHQEALQQRLEDFLVLELHKDGTQKYLNLSVRGMYKHVLGAITSKESISAYTRRASFDAGDRRRNSEYGRFSGQEHASPSGRHLRSPVRKVRNRPIPVQNKRDEPESVEVSGEQEKAMHMLAEALNNPTLGALNNSSLGTLPLVTTDDTDSSYEMEITFHDQSDRFSPPSNPGQEILPFQQNSQLEMENKGKFESIEMGQHESESENENGEARGIAQSTEMSETGGEAGEIRRPAERHISPVESARPEQNPHHHPIEAFEPRARPSSIRNGLLNDVGHTERSVRFQDDSYTQNPDGNSTRRIAIGEHYDFRQPPYNDSMVAPPTVSFESPTRDPLPGSSGMSNFYTKSKEAHLKKRMGRRKSIAFEERPEAEISYRERLGSYLHPRDMRRLVTPFSASNEPDIIVRRHVILLNFDPLRAVILRDRLLVIVPEGADSVLVQLEKRVRGGSAELENSFFGAPSRLDTLGSSHPHENLEGEGSEHKKFQEGFFEKMKETAGMIKKTAGMIARVVVHDDHSLAESKHSTGSGQHGEWADMVSKEWVSLPFELQCADAVLHTVSGILTKDTYGVSEETTSSLRSIGSDDTGFEENPLTVIRDLRDKVRVMQGRVKGFVQSLSRTLNVDEDMALMNLSRLLTHPERFVKPVPPDILEEESDEPELILESYLQQSLSLQNALILVQGSIDSSAELVNQKLDSTRNKILLANMVISTIALCVDCAAIVGSFFGMNLTNHFEDSETAFTKVVFGTIAGSILLCTMILAILFYSGAIPRFRGAPADEL